MIFTHPPLIPMINLRRFFRIVWFAVHPRGARVAPPPPLPRNVSKLQRQKSNAPSPPLSGFHLFFFFAFPSQAFEKHCRLPVAFGSFPNVNDLKARPEDRMESFFLAETLKYLYLIQDPDQKVRNVCIYVQYGVCFSLFFVASRAVGPLPACALTTTVNEESLSLVAFPPNTP